MYVRCTSLKDLAGNTNTNAIANGTVIVDIDGPTISVSPNGSTDWKKSYTPSITVTDNGSAGVDTNKVYYSWNQSEAGDGTTSISGVTSGTAKALPEYGKDTITGTYYLHLTAYDNADNKTTIVKSFKFDNEAPDKTAPSLSVTTDSLTITGSQVDSKAGINASTWQFQFMKTIDGKWSDWINADTDGGKVASIDKKHGYTITMNTEYQVRTRVKDILGNGYSESNITKKTTSDINTPQITASTYTWTNENVEITVRYSIKQDGKTYTEGVTMEHAVVGLNTAYSDVKSTDWIQDSGDTSFSIAENKTIYARQSDESGQEMFDKLDFTKIDTTPPDKPTVTVNTNNTLSITSADAESGINGYWLMNANEEEEPSFTESGWNKTSDTTWLSPSKNTGTWYVWARDLAGNISKSSDPVITEANLTIVRDTETYYFPSLAYAYDYCEDGETITVINSYSEKQDNLLLTYKSVTLDFEDWTVRFDHGIKVKEGTLHLIGSGEFGGAMRGAGNGHYTLDMGGPGNLIAEDLQIEGGGTFRCFTSIGRLDWRCNF